MPNHRKNLPPRKFNFGDEVQTPSGKGEIIGIHLREDGWNYKTDTDDLDFNDPKNWWREELLSHVKSNIAI